jgi:glyoxylase-like metal-dependent hydrolase (beta-lactamase superfamily II)
MLLPKEKVIFAVDFIPVQAVFWRSMPDSWLDEWETSLKRVLAMDWDKLIPGHPGPGGRLGNKQDVENLQQYGDGGKGGGRRRQVLRQCHERGEAAEVRVMGQLRRVVPRQRRALLLAVP